MMGSPLLQIVLPVQFQGQFYRKNKTTRHPHTNMAKAALNMMVRQTGGEGRLFDSCNLFWVFVFLDFL